MNGTAGRAPRPWKRRRCSNGSPLRQADADDGGRKPAWRAWGISPAGGTGGGGRSDGRPRGNRPENPFPAFRADRTGDAVRRDRPPPASGRSAAQETTALARTGGQIEGPEIGPLVFRVSTGRPPWRYRGGRRAPGAGTSAAGRRFRPSPAGSRPGTPRLVSPLRLQGGRFEIADRGSYGDPGDWPGSPRLTTGPSPRARREHGYAMDGAPWPHRKTRLASPHSPGGGTVWPGRTARNRPAATPRNGT